MNLIISRCEKIFFEVLEKYKITLRTYISHYTQKICECEKIEGAFQIINTFNSIVLPNLANSIKQELNQIPGKNLPLFKEEIKRSFSLLPLMTTLKKAEQETQRFKESKDDLLKHKEEWLNKEKKLKDEIQKLENEISKLRTHAFDSKGFLKRLFKIKSEKKLFNIVCQKAVEIINLYGQLCFARIYLHYLLLLENINFQIIQWLDNEYIPEIKSFIRKIEQSEEILKVKLNALNTELQKNYSFEIDLGTNEKIAQLERERFSNSNVETTALILKERLGELSPDEIVACLLATNRFNDILEWTAGKRLIEIYSDEKLGSKLLEFIKKEASPLNPLNSELLDNDPIRIAVIGVEDEVVRQQIINSFSERNIEGDCNIVTYPDPEKIVIFTTHHRIPAFALAGIQEWLKAAESKEKNEKVAVYPERRWKEYKPITPIVSEKKIDNLIALGIAADIIKFYGPGFYQLNGRKIHGIENLRKVLSTNFSIQNEIIEKWIEIYRNKGVSGIFQQIDSTLASSINSPQFLEIKNLLNNIKVSLSNEKVLSEEILRQKFVGV